MKPLSNQDTIQAWSDYSRDMINVIGDDGDAARRYILNPALFALLGDVAGRSILDAGCGTGYVSRLLAKRNAQVTGVEPAPALFAYCVEREQTERLGITYHQRDLSAVTRDHTRFDVVVANMVFMDIPDYEAAMLNCIHVLKPGGQFLFSLLHPCFDEVDSPAFAKGYGSKGFIRVDDYLNEFVVRQGVGYYIHRPLSAYLNLIITAGCTLKNVHEPTLTPDGIAVLGKHNHNMYVPNFIVISAIKG